MSESSLLSLDFLGFKYLQVLSMQMITGNVGFLLSPLMLEIV